jgi:hypothetical protein
VGLEGGETRLYFVPEGVDGVVQEFVAEQVGGDWAAGSMPGLGYG